MTFATLFRVLSGTIGLAVSLAAIFAQAIGLDTNSDWGPSRYLMLIAGLAFIAIGLEPLIRKGMAYGYSIFRDALVSLANSSVVRKTSHLLSRVRLRFLHVQARVRESAIGKASRWLTQLVLNLPALKYLRASRYRRGLIITLLAAILCFGFYFWLITLGRGGPLPALSSLYDSLAIGFSNGSLALPLTPSAELLAAEDPYAMEARRFISQAWDISFYQGRFYMYWGPVPGLVALLVRLLLARGISDSALAFMAVSGSLIAASAILLSIWRRLYKEQPAKRLIPPMLAVGFAIPLPWLLSRPAVYEAATGTGQLFLLIGIGLLLPYWMGESPGLVRSFAASLSLGLAVGSRVNLAPAALWLLFSAILFKWSAKGSSGRSKIGSIAALVVPISLAGVLLLAYNYGRFGELLEFGHRYQLGRENFNASYGGVVNFGNIIPNAYNYLVNMPDFISVFPYLKPDWGQYYIWPAHYYAPEDYYTEQITGILIGIPFVWMAWGALSSLFTALRRRIKDALPWRQWLRSFDSRHRLTITFLGATILLLGPLLLFLAATMRHLTDVAPTMLILASMGYWQLAEAANGDHSRSRFVCYSSWILAIATALIGILLAMTGFGARFEQLNPELFSQLTRFFTP